MARRTGVPQDVAGLALLERVDYADAFTTDVPVGRRPGEWVRAALGDAPGPLLAVVRRIQLALGLQLAEADAEHPLGWTVLRDEPRTFVLGVDGDVGSARVVCTTPDGAVVLTTQLRFDRARLRRLWVVAVPAHRAAVRYLLERERRRGTTTAR